MTTARPSRRSRRARRSGLSSPGRRTPAVVAESVPGIEIGDPEPVASWAGRTISVQLAASCLVDGRLPSLAVGAVLPLTPVIYMTAYTPASGAGGGWWGCGEGMVCARGLVAPPRPTVEGTVSLVLDVADRFFPMNWTNPEAFLSPWIETWGALYLDPRMEPGGIMAADGEACRRHFEVVALRRYLGRPAVRLDPVAPDRVPVPGAARRDEAYVADLVEA